MALRRNRTRQAGNVHSGWERNDTDCRFSGTRTVLLNRLVVILVVCSLSYAGIFALPLWNWRGASVLLILATAGVLLPRLHRSTGSLTASTDVFACVVFVAMVSLIEITGGLQSPGMMWLAIVPMLATMLNGPRSGGTWLAVVAVETLIIGLTDPSEFLALQSLTPAGLRMLSTLSVIGLAACVFACLTVEYFNISKAHERLHDLALHDGMTGLLNHRALLSLLRETTIPRSEEEGDSPGGTLDIGLIILDLDYFKRINDRHGHAVGDLALQELADRLTRCVRAEDHVGRYGGEEFLCILPRCSLVTALDIAESIRSSIEAPDFELGNARIPVTVSLGVTVFDPRHDRDGLDTLQRADRALYAAKRGGRNQIRLGEFETQADQETAVDVPRHELAYSDACR